MHGDAAVIGVRLCPVPRYARISIRISTGKVKKVSFTLPIVVTSDVVSCDMEVMMKDIVDMSFLKFRVVLQINTMVNLGQKQKKGKGHRNEIYKKAVILSFVPHWF